MSLSLAAKTIFNADHLTVVRVQSLKCHYRVSISDGVANIMGPGVNEEYELADLGPLELPAEAQAIIAVILFEEA